MDCQYVKLRRENVQICDEKNTKVHLNSLNEVSSFFNYVEEKSLNFTFAEYFTCFLLNF